MNVGGSGLPWLDVLVAVLGGAIRVGTPFLFVSLGECITEKAGRINLGLEGVLVFSAMAGFAGSYLTGAWWAGVLLAGASGALIALVHGLAWLVSTGPARARLEAQTRLAKQSGGRLAWVECGGASPAATNVSGCARARSVRRAGVSALDAARGALGYAHLILYPKLRWSFYDNCISGICRGRSPRRPSKRAHGGFDRQLARTHRARDCRRRAPHRSDQLREPRARAADG
jgi:hypothetical protein